MASLNDSPTAAVASRPFTREAKAHSCEPEGRVGARGRSSSRGVWLGFWIAAALAAVYAGTLGQADSHRTNLAYLAWKSGLNPDYRDGIRYFNVDVSFRESFIGRPISALRRYFPAAESGSADDRRSGNSPFPLEQREVEVAPGSGWIAEVEGARVRSIRMSKG